MTHHKKESIAQEHLLVEECKRNPRKFGILYDRYYKAIFLFIYKRIDDEMLSEDLCSQAFMKAMANIIKYENKGFPFSSWLYKIALNEINLHFRSTKNQRAISLEDAGIYRLGEEMTLENDDYEEKMNCIIHCLNYLSEDEVELLELRFFENRAFKEVGYLLNLTENNAKVKSHRLIEKMKQLIKKMNLAHE